MNLDADIGQIVQNFFKGRKIDTSFLAADSPYKEAFIYSAVIVTLSVIYIFAIYMPRYSSNTMNHNKLIQLSLMQQNFEGLSGDIESFKEGLVQQEKHYNEILNYFSNSKDLGKLYQSITTLSSIHNITITSIKENGASPLPQYDMIEEIRVEVELRGAYNSYMQFKSDLYKNEPLLRIQKESLHVGQDVSNPGLIYVKLEFSTYAIDKKPFLEAISDDK